MGDLNLCNAIFGARLIDYERDSYGLLIGSGAGIMMAVMDECPSLRFCLDADEFRGDLRAWVRALVRNELVDMVAVAGWFSISDPTAIARAVEDLSVPTVIYIGGGIGAEKFSVEWGSDLEEFLGEVQKKGRHREVPPFSDVTLKQVLLPAHRDKFDGLRVAQHPSERSLEPK